MVVPQPNIGKDLVFISGYVRIGFKGGVKAPQINRDSARFGLGSKWDSVDEVVPSVTLASIFNDGPANDAGWAGIRSVMIHSWEVNYESSLSPILLFVIVMDISAGYRIM
jgi:hypothetical protein